LQVNNEDYLLVVPTRGEDRTDGREGSPQRQAGNARDLRRSSPWSRDPLAGIDS